MTALEVISEITEQLYQEFEEEAAYATHNSLAGFDTAAEECADRAEALLDRAMTLGAVASELAGLEPIEDEEE